MGPPPSDRFAQPTTPARTDIGRSSMTRPFLSSSYNTGYGYQDPQYGASHLQSSSPMQGVEMQYSPAYMSEASRQQQVRASPSQQQQQQQQYPQYGPSSLLPPVGPQSLYENMPFQPGQTAIEVMSSRFAVPGYMPSGEHAGTALGSGPTQFMTSQPEPSAFGHAAVSRPAMPQTYGAGPVDFPMVEQQETEEPVNTSGVQEALDEALRDYHQQVRSVLDAIIAGRVTAASEKLLAVSRWLVTSVTALGKLHRRSRSQSRLSCS